MAISMKHKSITIDVNDRNAPNVVGIVNVNDKATRYLDVTLTASGEKLTFADCTVTATFATDGYLISDSVACTLNSTADVITVPLENFKSMSGFLAIEIKIASGETQVLNTPLTLKVMVTPNLAENSKINSESAGSFAEISREVVTARGGQSSLGARLDTADANLANKADKSTTLAGYGITDAYTKEKTDQKLAQKLNSMPFDDEPKNNSPCYLTSGTVYNALLKNESLTNKVNSALEIKDRTVNYPTIKYLDNYFVTTDQAGKSYEKQSNRVTDISKPIVDKSFTYPSVKYLESYLDKHYYTKNNLYASDLIDVKLQTKYDSSNIESGTSTLTPYSTITDKIKSASCVYKTIGDVVIISATVKMNAVTIGASSAYLLIDLPYKCISADDVFCVGISNLGKLFKIAVPKNNTWLQFQSQDKTAYTFADGEQINVICSYKIK